MVCEPNGLVDSVEDAEVQIPYAFVKLVMSSTSTTPFGFCET